MPTATLVANSSASMTLPLVAAVGGKDGRRHSEHEAYEQHGDARDAAVKRALLAAPVEHLGDASQVGVRTGGNDKRHGSAVLHGGAGKDDVLAGRERQRGAVGALDDGDGSGLLDGLALAGECGFDDKQVARGDDAGIGWNHIAGRETDYIAGDELVEGDLDALAVAQGGASVGDQVLEGLGRIAAAGFLDKLHAARYQQHGADDDDRGGVALRFGHGEHVDVERDQCERGEDTGEGIDERVGDAGGRAFLVVASMVLGPTAFRRSVACSTVRPFAVASISTRASSALWVAANMVFLDRPV